MLFAALVVEQRAVAAATARAARRSIAGRRPAALRRRHRELQQVQRRRARRRSRTARSPRSASSSALRILRAEAALRDRSSARRRMRDHRASSSGFSTKTFERDSSAALTSNDGFSVVAPIEHDVAGFDARQERILLRLVEAVDLVDEDDRAPAGHAAALFRARP